ncbi:flagellar filament capping protein FliD [Azoarcus taiwanensis]|uniref:Flagellar hook-associated protein 2 n=1 Tax=Azoarcus taiwanensis TaxID=666964 RepID=A0A972FGG3_9RHOO|nr:flagellar filament capping protein FliD [Azoarcus taiwanensis]NMG04260.1 flagellar filament capping protein FliD [Azoarcus taiwanensis]
MAGITSLGVGSGLDLAGILRGLMQIEQQPLVNLQRKEVSYQARISALGSLRGALSALQTSASALPPDTGKTAAEKYSSFLATVADTDIATASASTGAAPGVYALEVSQLAQSQRLVSAPLTSADSTIAEGTLTIDFGTLEAGVYTADSARQLEVTIDSSNNTLAGLRDAINAANGGVTATIITGTAGAQLVLTAKDSGSKNVMQLTGLTGFDFDATSAAGDLSQDPAQGGRAAQNAEFTVNGIAASSSTNTVSGVLDGVTLTLKKTNIGTPTDITVRKDTTTALKANLNAFVKAFNEAASTISSLGSYNAETKESGPLQGQAVIRTTQSQLRNLVFNTTAGGTTAFQRLADIGVTFNKEGELSIDSAKLDKALEEDYEAVLRLTTNVGEIFKSSLDTVVGSTGTISGLTDSLNRMIKDLDSQRSILNQRLTNIEERYRKQFTALDTLVASMKDTSNYLTQQLASLPGVWRNQ